MRKISPQSAQLVRSIVCALVVWLCVANAYAASIELPGAPLSGTYLIGAAPSDYPDLTSALDDLHVHGINAPVQLQVKPGLYPLHITVSEIQRHGEADDVVTLMAQDPSNPPLFTHTVTTVLDNWMIRLMEAQYIHIEHFNLLLTGTTDYGNVIQLEGVNSHLRIANNLLQLHTTDSTAFPDLASGISAITNSRLNDIKIRNNVFVGGRGGITLENYPFEYSSEVDVRNNFFIGQDSVASFYVIKGNFIDGLNVVGNWIFNDNFGNKGLRLFRVNDSLIDGNVFLMMESNDGSRGIELSYINDDGISESMVRNNFVIAGAIAVNLSSETNNVRLQHNTLVVDGTVAVPSSPVAALFINVLPPTPNIHSRNNILINRISSNDRHALWVEEVSDLTSSDHNIYYSESPRMIHIGGVEYDDLGALHAALNLDLFSHNQDIDFIDEAAGDLHLSDAQHGDPNLQTPAVNTVTHDIDGELRDATTARIGADDYTRGTIFRANFD